ncbi:MAG: OmpH family outer membrane protein [Deltaproteobacteria bacterium]|nr:OmpH family outer membrane protein [Deltaproteobacteria bacterium]
MRICKTFLAVFLFLTFTTQVWAAEVVKLGFFDKQDIVDRSELGKEGLATIKAEMQPIREKLEASRQEIKELKEEFKKKEPIWSDEVKKTKYLEIVSKEKRLEQDVEQANRSLSKRERELLEPLQTRVLEIVAKIGKEGGYTMIFEVHGAGILYAPDSLNLTDKIIEELNAISASQKTEE